MTYVFRNNTIERFFCGEYTFSGYDDYTAVPQADDYLWWYQVPLKFDSTLIAEEIDSYAEKLSWVSEQISNKQLIVLTMVNFYNAIQCVQNDWHLQNAIERFNRVARELSLQKHTIKVIDFEDFIQRVYHGEWKELVGTPIIDWKFFFLSQMPINPRWSSAFQQWFNEKKNAIALKRKKCLVLDLDNTLWHGILGEDGLYGIKMSGDYPGKAFHYWQEGLKQLSKDGVILAICSKNNTTDVDKVWETYQDMPLKKQDFVAVRINWQDKATNLMEIAEELNIGLDSIVFVDDNPSERELIRQQLPMVTVPDFPNQPYELPNFYKKLVNDYFLVYSLTNEDRNKTEQYRQNAQRVQEKKKFNNLDDFLKSLQMNLSIDLMNESTLSRVAQMTQKTNQFNLTTKRYTEDDIRKLIDEKAKIWTLSVSDRFGDYGISGLLITLENKESIDIDTLLLSCRILGKGIEQAFVKTIFNYFYKLGVKNIIGTYIRTEKNAQVDDFYDSLGFKVERSNIDEKHYSMYMSQKYTISDIYNITIN